MRVGKEPHVQDEVRVAGSVLEAERPRETRRPASGGVSANTSHLIRRPSGKSRWSPITRSRPARRPPSSAAPCGFSPAWSAGASGWRRRVASYRFTRSSSEASRKTILEADPLLPAAPQALGRARRRTRALPGTTIAPSGTAGLAASSAILGSAGGRLSTTKYPRSSSSARPGATRPPQPADQQESGAGGLIPAPAALAISASRRSVTDRVQPPMDLVGEPRSDARCGGEVSRLRLTDPSSGSRSASSGRASDCPTPGISSKGEERARRSRR